MTTQLDHLVVAADDLASGVAWCEQTLGVTPGPGGEHPLMGTHNRLLRIDSPGFAAAYLEIIAIQPGARPQRVAPLQRWFDLDDPSLQQRIRQHGPQLVHWVARTPDVQRAVSAWQHLGIDRGVPLAASRATPEGLLQWQITVRNDGQRLMDGCLPTLIQWGERHPTERMAPSGLALRSLRLVHTEAALLQQALAAIALAPAGPIQIAAGAPQLEATLDTPRGPVTVTGPA